VGDKHSSLLQTFLIWDRKSCNASGLRVDNGEPTFDRWTNSPMTLFLRHSFGRVAGADEKKEEDPSSLLARRNKLGRLSPASLLRRTISVALIMCSTQEVPSLFTNIRVGF
jgi:hypothetical protein